MKPSYQWTRGGWNVDAQTAGDHLDRLRKMNADMITPALVVDDARHNNSPLHRAFEWDDKIAGPKYREIQAGELIRSLKVVVLTPESASEPTRQVRAFVSVTPAGEVGGDEPAASYTPIRLAMAKPDLRKQVVQQAWRELQSWREKYKNLSELAGIFAAMDENDQRLVG